MDHEDHAALGIYRSRYTDMTDSTLPTHFVFEAADNGICTIRLDGRISAEFVSAVAQSVMMYIGEHDLPAGLLLDARHNENLSVVRLSSLVDTLSGMGIPLAVVFGGYAQQSLAALLHNTLAQKDYVAYFTDPEAARAYLLASTARNTPVSLQ
jgi:hypothetical protein